VQLIWRNTQDVEFKELTNWQKVANFSVATNRTWTDHQWQKQEHAEFSNVVVWWKLSEIAKEYLKKWARVYIEWRLQTKSWEWDDWVKKYKTEIVWENIILLDSKNNWVSE